MPGEPDGPECLEFCRDYLIAFEEALSQAKSSEELIAAVKKRFPETRDLAGDFILPLSAQVATGEIPPAPEHAGLGKDEVFPTGG
jgi:hypothetical protein